jgi:CRISPR-associated exonuclease Cas4
VTTTLLAWFAVAVAAACIAAFALHRLRGARARRAEQASRPVELAGAGLLYMERQFRIRKPISLVARIDRAYRAADGAIVLIELKTRWKSRAYATDVIQLSAQKMALEGQTGQRVAAHAFVTVQKPTRNTEQRSYKVELLQPSEVVGLYRRRQDVVAGRVAPRYAKSSRACKECAFRARCDKPNG